MSFPFFEHDCPGSQSVFDMQNFPRFGGDKGEDGAGAASGLLLSFRNAPTLTQSPLDSYDGITHRWSISQSRSDRHPSAKTVRQKTREMTTDSAIMTAVFIPSLRFLSSYKLISNPVLPQVQYIIQTSLAARPSESLPVKENKVIRESPLRERPQRLGKQQDMPYALRLRLLPEDMMRPGAPDHTNVPLNVFPLQCKKQLIHGH
jgi:hypothetical protein